MNHRLVLHLPQRGKRAVYLQIGLVMIMLWLRDVLGFPPAITYLTDVITVFLLLSAMRRINRGAALAKAQCAIVVLIIANMLLGAAINFVSPVLTLWGARNNLRFFAFFFVCIGVLDVWDVDTMTGIFKKFFWANVAMCTIQYFFLGQSNDDLGGFFGVAQGSNGYLNVFLCMIAAILLAEFFTEKVKLRTVFLYLIVCVYVASLAELKVYYVELIVMVITAVIFVRPSLKTVGICLLSVVAIGIGVVILAVYNPRSLEILFDSSALDYYLNGDGYTAAGDLNRFTAVQELYSRFFSADPLLALFGFGLGSCEYASFTFLQSAFYLEYGHLHYRWLSHAWVYLEQGAVGLILLVLFFVSLGVYSIRKKQAIRRDLVMTTLVFLPTCLIGLIYNSTLQMEACYLIAFMCAIPFVLSKADRQNS